VEAPSSAEDNSLSSAILSVLSIYTISSSTDTATAQHAHSPSESDDTLLSSLCTVRVRTDDVVRRRGYCDHIVTMCVVSMCVGMYVGTIRRKPLIGMTLNLAQ